MKLTCIVRQSKICFAVVLPDRAIVLDWVFADGSPQRATAFDNNRRQDFHAIVPESSFEELTLFEEEQIYNKLQAERQLREGAIQAKVCFCNLYLKMKLFMVFKDICCFVMVK